VVFIHLIEAGQLGFVDGELTSQLFKLDIGADLDPEVVGTGGERRQLDRLDWVGDGIELEGGPVVSQTGTSDRASHRKQAGNSEAGSDP
jgi:hypothetical protein